MVISTKVCSNFSIEDMTNQNETDVEKEEDLSSVENASREESAHEMLYLDHALDWLESYIKNDTIEDPSIFEKLSQKINQYRLPNTKTILSAACSQKREHSEMIVRKLLELGADPSIKDDIEGKNALQYSLISDCGLIRTNINENLGQCSNPNLDDSKPEFSSKVTSPFIVLIEYISKNSEYCASVLLSRNRAGQSVLINAILALNMEAALEIIKVAYQQGILNSLIDQK
ncbi:MAG: hypothetical protein MHPSP_003491 [Paramarteilia canceri]